MCVPHYVGLSRERLPFTVMPIPPQSRSGLVELRVGCRFEFDVAEASPVALMVEPLKATPLSARWTLPDGVLLPEPERDVHGNGVRRIVLAPGHSVIDYEATIAVPGDLDPDPAASRYCSSSCPAGTASPTV
jgi:hypothetical protein